MNTKENPQTSQSPQLKKRPGAPVGNQNGRRHGFYSKLHPVNIVDVFDRLNREQGKPPLDPASARRLASLCRDPRMSQRLLVDAVRAMRTLITFHRALKRIEERGSYDPYAAD